MSERGEINGYRCDKCGKTTMTIHIDDGVTPMFLACRAGGLEPGPATCGGQGTSMMYPSGPLPPAYKADLLRYGWEWFKPDVISLRRESVAMQEHVLRGGLMLRRLTDAGRELVTEQALGIRRQ